MLSNELASSFTSIHALLFSPFYKFIACLALLFAGGCISTAFMHLDKDKGQYKSDYLTCETQAKNEQAIPSSVSFTLMINKWIKGVITDEFSDCMEGKGWKQVHERDDNASSSNQPTHPPEETSKTLQQLYSGTGFLFSAKDYVITNWHVVRGTNNIKVKFLNGEKIEAEVALKDPQNDIAFLKLERQPKLPPSDLKIGDSSKVRMGDKVFTIGYPAHFLMGDNPKYTEGVVNAISGLQNDPTVLQISVQIQPGNSGGPLFNSSGEVIGITQSSLDPKVAIGTFGTLPQNVNYAIKSSYISTLLPMLPQTLIASRGIVIVPAEPENTLANFIEKAKKNIVLIEAKE